MMTPGKKQVPAATTPATQPVQPAPTAPAATAVAAQATKAEQTFAKLQEAWKKRGVDFSKVSSRQDGKSIIVLVGEGWPTLKIGQGGGITLMELRSYGDPFAAAVIGDQLLAKQTERDVKKQSGAAPATTGKTTEQPKPEAPKETTAQKKARQHQQLEKQMS